MGRLGRFALHRRMSCFLGLAIFAFSFPSAGQFFDTASGAATGTSASMNDRFWLLHRFQVTSTVTIGTVGGHFHHPGCAPIGRRTAFAALVALTGSSDVPDSVDLSTSDVIATTLITVPGFPGGVGEAPLTATLSPGWYGLAFGTGEFGADLIPNGVSPPDCLGMDSLDTDLEPSQFPLTIDRTAGTFVNSAVKLRFFATQVFPFYLETFEDEAPYPPTDPELNLLGWDWGDTYVGDGTQIQPTLDGRTPGTVALEATSVGGLGVGIVEENVVSAFGTGLDSSFDVGVRGKFRDFSTAYGPPGTFVLGVFDALVGMLQPGQFGVVANLQTLGPDFPPEAGLTTLNVVEGDGVQQSNNILGPQVFLSQSAQDALFSGKAFTLEILLDRSSAQAQAVLRIEGEVFTAGLSLSLLTPSVEIESINAQVLVFNNFEGTDFGDGDKVGVELIELAGFSSEPVAFCGDGQVTGDEECDDGNADTGDGCRPDCTQEICGHAILDPQEQCDDGDLTNGDGCQANCALPICGDGIVDLGEDEQCDDGNLDDGDECSGTCHIEVCGNGIVDPDEQCDDANVDLGDGCRPNCTQELCGDGMLDPQEQCDDGNNSPGDGCRADCSEEICGDGTNDPQEQCDDGNVVDGDGCSTSCQTEECGNGILDPDEACDDGNISAGDGCRADCSIEICGDGVPDPQEQCDDGNVVSGDGCSEACESEAGSGEGCTSGYWKQEHHFDSWPASYAPGTVAEGGTPFADVFEDAFPNQSLSQVLRNGGGGLKALGRHSVAALLNAASSEVSYDLTSFDVVDMFDQTHPGTKRAYNTLKNNFESFNEQGCPLN